MGLDQYLIAKLKRNDLQVPCELETILNDFNISQCTNKYIEFEIAYFRKNYELNDYIFDVIIDTEGQEPNCKDYRLDIADINQILDYCEIRLKELDEASDAYCNQSYTKLDLIGQWRATKAKFQKVKNFLNLFDNSASVYYHIWY